MNYRFKYCMNYQKLFVITQPRSQKKDTNACSKLLPSLKFSSSEEMSMSSAIYLGNFSLATYLRSSKNA